MDTQAQSEKHGGMPAKPPLQFRKLYIGEWLSRLDIRAEYVANQVGIQPSYMSQLISGKKANPSARLLLAISEVMGMTVNDLYQAPPGANQLSAVSTLSPVLLTRLLEQARARK